MQNKIVFWVMVCALLAASGLAHAQQAAPEASSASDTSKANNPLTAAIGVNFQDYYAPALYGAPDANTNTFLFRGMFPVQAGLVQLVRVTLPVITAPAGTGEDPQSGLGDLNLFDIFLLTGPDAAVQFGIGPQLTFPTHTHDALGFDALQLGAAVTLIYQPSPLLLLGGLITWQTKISGDDKANQLMTQPFVILQVGGGFYLRSTAIPTFNFVTGDYAVPFGVGVGKVMRVDKVVLNMFIEPQYTFLHDGIGQPEFQLFTGINLQIF
ncbi:MAG TPA: hypothetical protein VJV78_18430 [Polyangiales bacterium]|nr:hypothetical protein [Polyangiales bacterium]